MEENKIKEELINFLSENFLLAKDDSLDETASFMDTGILDSTGVLELIDFIEETFSIEVGDEEMIPENLDSIQNAVAFIKKKLG
jgi:acyl carrier protein